MDLPSALISLLKMVQLDYVTGMILLGSSLVHNGNLYLKSDNAYLLNYGSFISTGQVNAAIAFASNNTVSAFNELYIRGATILGTASIKSKLVIYESRDVNCYGN